ncbi:MAG TPA: hypothetical protein VMS12_05550 [Thermoanaerobaculia bacterium]|nr:hypothetical protein [Thermoanaerobaculia bacterium]
MQKAKRAETLEQEIANIDRDALREAVVDLVLAEPFMTLRNRIAHHGMRPTQPVAEHYYEQIPALAPKLLRAFGVIQGQLIMPPTAGGRRRARSN